MNLSLYILIAVVVVAAWIIWAFNRGVCYRNYVQEAFSTMDVYLKKRWDLIPNLIEMVKSYAAHEKKLLSDIALVRSKSYADLSDDEKINTNLELGQTLSKIIAVAENYPDLKANNNYMQLMTQMSAVEEDIADARKYYNGTVREYNTFLDLFPTSVIGKIFGMQRAEMFEIEEQQRENIKADI